MPNTHQILKQRFGQHSFDNSTSSILVNAVSHVDVQFYAYNILKYNHKKGGWRRTLQSELGTDSKTKRPRQSVIVCPRLSRAAKWGNLGLGSIFKNKDLPLTTCEVIVLSVHGGWHCAIFWHASWFLDPILSVLNYANTSQQDYNVPFL